MGGHLLPSGTETFAVGTSHSAGSDDPEAGKGLNRGFDCPAAVIWASGSGAAPISDVRGTMFPSLVLLGTALAWQSSGHAGTSASHLSRAAGTL